MSRRRESAKSVVYVLNAPNPKAVDELSSASSATSCWIIYVLMLEVRRRDEILKFVSISWRVRSRKRHVAYGVAYGVENLPMTFNSHDQGKNRILKNSPTSEKAPARSKALVSGLTDRKDCCASLS